MNGRQAKLAQLNPRCASEATAAVGQACGVLGEAVLGLGLRLGLDLAVVLRRPSKPAPGVFQKHARQQRLRVGARQPGVRLHRSADRRRSRPQRRQTLQVLGSASVVELDHRWREAQQCAGGQPCVARRVCCEAVLRRLGPAMQAAGIRVPAHNRTSAASRARAASRVRQAGTKRHIANEKKKVNSRE